MGTQLPGLHTGKVPGTVAPTLFAASLLWPNVWIDQDTS